MSVTLMMTVHAAAATREYSPVIIFVSFSMPDASLKAWMKQAEIIRAPVVIRGLINHSFKSTIQKMSELTQDNHGGVQLDPLLFRQYQIEQVPAVVVRKKVNCLSSQSCVEKYDVIYGNVTLDFTLKQIAEQNDELSEVAMHALAILQGEKNG